MHPRLEGIAIDRSDNVDGMPDIQDFLACFQIVSLSLAACIEAGAGQCRSGSIVPATTAATTPRARPPKTSRADGPDKYLFSGMGTYSQRKPATNQQG